MAQAAKKTTVPRVQATSIIGWNGIYLEAPLGWDLAAVSGDMTAGNLRVDGPNDTHIRVKWRKERNQVNLESILDRYLETIKKRAKRTRSAFESSANVHISLHKDQEKRKPLFFSWTSAMHALGMIWHCPACGRITIAQVDGPVGRNLTLLTTQVLGTLDDHAIDGCHTWAAYGLAADVPADFTLGKNKLLSGYIQLSFTKKQSGVLLDRWGLADVLLRRVGLETWMRNFFAKAWKPYRLVVEPAEVRGHTGFCATGDLKGARDRARAWGMRLARMSPATRLTQYVWECPETNRICSVQVTHTGDEEGLAEEIAASYVCHANL